MNIKKKAKIMIHAEINDSYVDIYILMLYKWLNVVGLRLTWLLRPQDNESQDKDKKNNIALCFTYYYL